MVSGTVLTAVTLLPWGKAVHGSGQQLLQRAHVHAMERGFLGGSLTKINCKNEVSLPLLTVSKRAKGTEDP